MAASQADIDRLRLCIEVPADKTEVFNDTLLGAVLESYPVNDSSGLRPDDSAWTATYDLNAAAAYLWGLITGNLSKLYDFQADGASFSREQLYRHAIERARWYNARRRARSVAISKDREQTILYAASWPWYETPGAEPLSDDLQTYFAMDEAAHHD